MTDTQVLTIAASLVATLFGLLVTILGWLGNKIYSKLDEVADTMHSIEGDLRGKIGDLDRRVTVVETRCTARHDLSALSFAGIVHRTLYCGYVLCLFI
jgi:hypothetical protein